MALLQETQGLETILGMTCVVLSVIGMMAAGMMMDLMKQIVNVRFTICQLYVYSICTSSLYKGEKR